jgi:pimeloyl-ACP methyl ester carboxylesterase
MFNHGWGAVDPWTYGAWIEHIVRRGNIVIFPRYQANLLEPAPKFAPNAIVAMKAALTELQDGADRVRPDKSRLAVVGHSAGGLLSANFASRAKDACLPPPLAVFCVQPGRSEMRPGVEIPLMIDDLSKIPATTLLLTIAGEEDTITGDIDARKIVARATQVPAENKAFLLMPSDRRGFPPLLATHMSPIAIHPRELEEGSGEDPASNGDAAAALPRLLAGDFSGMRRLLRNRGPLRDAARSFPLTKELFDSVNAHDYFGYWRLFDALCDAAFHGKGRDEVLGDTAKQRFLGTWSDGVPVKELKVNPRSPQARE